MAKVYEKSAEYYDMFSIVPPDRELEFIEHCFKEMSGRKIQDILDAGSGTGLFSIPLAKKGYKVTGVDLSSEMNKVARGNAEKEGVSLKIVEGDMQSLPFSEEFDAVICMGDAFQYLLTDEAIDAAVQCFHKALRKKGILIIRITNFLAMMEDFKDVVILPIETEDALILRIFKYFIDEIGAVMNRVDFDLIYKDGKTKAVYEEHKFRILSLHEMKRFLSDATFKKIKRFRGVGEGGVKVKASKLMFVALK